MKICLVTPEPSESSRGNGVTASRWTAHLRALGHQVSVVSSESVPPETTPEDRDEPDLVVALHARRSARAIEHYARDRRHPVVVALTGTDVYQDIRTDESARRSLELASRLVVLQPLAIEEVPPSLRDRTRVIYQSVERPSARLEPDPDRFQVCVAAHLRPVKDPLLAARAARRLSRTSRIEIVHLGYALDDELGREAEEEMARNPRYVWRGEVSRDESLETIGRSRLLVISSRLEGGANALSEAIALGVPPLSSRIPGSMGILGEDYPGYFPVGDQDALTRLLERAENDPAFYASLEERSEEIAPLFDPERERRSWKELIDGLKRESHLT